MDAEDPPLEKRNKPINHWRASPMAESEQDPVSTSSAAASDEAEQEYGEVRAPTINQAEIFRALEVVDRDSAAIAESFTSLFASLRVALSEVTSCSVDHMEVFNDAAGRLQESVLDASTKGNRYINSCLRLNEEMKDIDGLATRLKALRRNVDLLDSAVNRLVRLPNTTRPSSVFRSSDLYDIV